MAGLEFSTSSTLTMNGRHSEPSLRFSPADRQSVDIGDHRVAREAQRLQRALGGGSVARASLLLALPIGEPAAGGLPALNGLEQFLIKDVVLLGVALVTAADGLADLARGSGARAAPS